jgi:hypothetical protein
MVSVPVRAAPVLAATLKVVVPLPVPVAPDATLIHGALLAAVQAHPAPTATATELPEAPEAPTDSVVGSIETEHPEAWATVKIAPVTVIVPFRAGPVLAATVYVKLPGPLRLEPEATVIHGAPLLALQAHPVAVCTATGPEPPPAGTATKVGTIE